MRFRWPRPHLLLWPTIALGLLVAGCGPDSPELDGASGEPLTADGSNPLAVCAEVQDPAPGSCVFATSGFYTSKEPYSPRQSADTYEAVPEGFSVVSIQHVGRHGSRTLSSPDDDDLVIQLWEAARDEGALTPLGELLGPELEELQRVHNEVGYGRTTQLGELEHEETARRMIARHRPFLEDVVARGGRIDVYHSGRTRAEESGVAFVRAMIDELPELQELVDPGQASVETVYFNEAEGSGAYEEYSDGDVRMLAAEDISFAGARALAADMVERVDRVVSGDASHPVTLRFSHSQALVPLAAWLGIEGAEEAAAPEELYTYDNNPWRSELVGPMAANVQWDVVQSPEGTTLVRMLHQEAEVPFAEGCRMWREGSFFYELDEIRRCYDL